MNKMQSQVSDFNSKFGVPTPAQAQSLTEERLNLRYRLMGEELTEWFESMVSGRYINAIKELCDLLYVTFGTAIEMGIDIEPFFDETHRSNMTKMWEDGTVHYDEWGKVLKPPTYSKADIRSILQQIQITQFNARAYDASAAGEVADEHQG